jgi:hypothetical protein
VLAKVLDGEFAVEVEEVSGASELIPEPDRVEVASDAGVDVAFWELSDDTTRF